MEDTRYPYTYACDLIRGWVRYSECGAKLSRGDASKIRHKIADIIGMDDHELACKLADYYNINQDKITENSVQEFMQFMVRTT